MAISHVRLLSQRGCINEEVFSSGPLVFSHVYYDGATENRERINKNHRKRSRFSRYVSRFVI